MGRLERLQGALIFVFAFCVYLLTRAPRLYFGDTGELAAASATLGVAHPTGYPLFVSVGFLWSRLPWSSPIVGLNVLAALWTAAGVFVSRQLLLELLRETDQTAAPALREAVAGAVALLVGFSTTVWSQATAYEVYSLHFVLLAATLWASGHSPWLAAVFFGVLLSNHLSSVFLGPGLVLLVRARVPRGSWKQWSGAALISLSVPALFSLLMVLRSAQLPAVNWGWVHRDAAAWWYHVTGAQFETWLFRDLEVVKTNVRTLGVTLGSSVLWLGLLVVIFGLWVQQRALRHGLLLWALGNVGISLGYGILDLEPYFLPALLAVAAWFALGLQALLRRARQAVWLGALALPLVALVLNWSVMNRSSHRAAERYVEWTLANAPVSSLILTHQWDSLYSPFLYLQTVENNRRDVVMVDTELLRRTWYLPQLERQHPSPLARVRSQSRAFLSSLQAFERDRLAFTEGSASTEQLQRLYVELLRALLEQHEGPVFVTPELFREQPWLMQTFQRLTVGPLVQLAKQPPSSRASAEGVEALASELEGTPSDRLVSSLRKTVALGAAGSAVAALQREGPQTAFQEWRALARRLDPDAQTTRVLNRVP